MIKINGVTYSVDELAVYIAIVERMKQLRVRNNMNKDENPYGTMTFTDIEKQIFEVGIGG